ncbi:hypothetical protein KQX54_005772 [Cotesia glomerata]|uniref:Uncharacterized protein n=1 Tax=Cotesia glomerata TaxID=32391 RepID=A0AAV7I1Q5_COTGL|nr:hypothetical protein KQX54_005772 [Cotesia glomerata]
MRKREKLTDSKRLKDGGWMKPGRSKASSKGLRVKKINREDNAGLKRGEASERLGRRWPEGDWDKSLAATTAPTHYTITI